MENELARDKVKQAIELLEKAYEEERKGFWETGNYDDTFYQGLICGTIDSSIRILKSILNY